MASIRFSNDPETPSIVNIGGHPVARVTMVMDEETKNALINLVNERRRILRKRVPSHLPVVEPVDNVEEALLDAMVGIREAGGAKWVRRNFGKQ